MSKGADRYRVVFGSMPASIAAASVNGLKVEPGCRCPWAKLNCVFLKLDVEAMATIAPVDGRIETRAAAGSQDPVGLPGQGGSRSTPRMARYASFCSFGSIVVVTRRPPPTTACEPKSESFSSCVRTYCSTYGSVFLPNSVPRFRPSLEAEAATNCGCVMTPW